MSFISARDTFYCTFKYRAAEKNSFPVNFSTRRNVTAKSSMHFVGILCGSLTQSQRVFKKHFSQHLKRDQDIFSEIFCSFLDNHTWHFRKSSILFSSDQMTRCILLSWSFQPQSLRATVLQFFDAPLSNTSESDRWLITSPLQNLMTS